MAEPIFQLMERLASAYLRVSRTDALAPLSRVIAILFIATAGMAVVGTAPTWLMQILAGLIGLSVATYLGAYVYLLFKDRDALRSEKYGLQKVAIERGMVGDSQLGVFKFLEGAEGLEMRRQLPGAGGGERDGR